MYDRFRYVMHEGDVDKRVQYTIEALFLVRKTGFEAAGFPAVPPELDLVEPEDQITHEVQLHMLYTVHVRSLQRLWSSVRQTVASQSLRLQ